MVLCFSRVMYSLGAILSRHRVKLSKVGIFLGEYNKEKGKGINIFKGMIIKKGCGK